MTEDLSESIMLIEFISPKVYFCKMLYGMKKIVALFIETVNLLMIITKFVMIYV